MKKTIAALAFATLLALPAFAADYKSEVEAFFALYEKGQKVEAVDRIYSTNKWMGSAADAIHNIKTQLQGIEEIVGAYNGRVQVGETNVKDRFVHVTWLALYERQPVRMEFQFYRPKNEWIIYSFAFDIAFADEVEQASRIAIARGE